MTEFSESDYKACRFCPTYKNLFRTYPQLNGLVKHKEGDDWEKVVKYILGMYQSASPFHKEYQELSVKKQAAAMMAGFDLVKDIFLLDKLFACQDEYAEVISDFMKLYGDSRLWALIQGDLQMFWEYNIRILKPVDEDRDKDDVDAILKKSKLSAEAELINERIERNEKKFYGDDSLLEALSKKPVRLTPESIASY